MADRILILIPAYNAAATLEKVFARIPGEVQKRIAAYVVVNDGSKDATAEVLIRLGERYPNLIALTHPVNRGYGGAMKTLLTQARQEKADVAIVLHADGQYSPESIPELLRPFDEDTADMVQGSRMLG